MRIIYLHQYFNTPDMSGGTRSYEMARRMVSAGHKVHMITSSRDSSEKNKRWTCELVEGINVHRIYVPYSNKMGFRDRISAFFRFSLEASKKATKIEGDVVYATSTPLTVAIPAIIAKIRHRIPMVFEVRDLWPELPIAVGALRHPLLKIMARALEWMAYHASAHIVALSPGMAEGIMNRGIPSSKISVIPNSCDVSFFDVSSEKGRWVREKLKLEANQPLIIYAGTFGMINGVGYLVDVAAIVRDLAPEVRFLLIGDGAEFDKVKTKAERLGVLNNNLWIWPPVTKTKMPDILAAATVATSLFIPLKAMENNSANKFFDALAAGKPVAINYGGWQADLLNKSGAGIVLSPNDKKYAAKRLIEFTRDEKRLEKASRAARILAHKRFNRDRLFVQLENVLKGVIHGEV